MKIIEVNNNKYVDQDLLDYINRIWLNFDIQVSNDSNIFFSKNTTIYRLITDYAGKNISRVIKREKAEYVVVKRFVIKDFPQYYDGVSITDDSSQEPVYGIYNNSPENISTIEMILDFVIRSQAVKYVNQDKLNDSLNNGFVIDNESYTSIKELIDSGSEDNQKLAVTMLIQSDLKSNWEWILYLFHGNRNYIRDNDEKNVIINYIVSLSHQHDSASLFRDVDSAMEVIVNTDVRNKFVQMVRSDFEEGIERYLSDTIGTRIFKLDDFKLNINV